MQIVLRTKKHTNKNTNNGNVHKSLDLGFEPPFAIKSSFYFTLYHRNYE